jgi:outer membrane receptor protein involved in Fe transport
MSYRGSLTFNIPLVDDKLAARLVVYNDHDGGFIDNVLGSTPDSLAIQNPNRPIAVFDGNRPFDLPAEWGTLDNAASVEKRWNDADIIGGRLSLLWQLNDSWSVDLTALHQEIDGGAGNHYDPFVGDLQTVRFHDDWREDEYDMFSLVVNADLGFADLVAAVSYYDRDVVYMTDITVYGHYWAGRYCIDSYYTTSSVSSYDLDGNGVYDDVLYPYYWENPDTGYIVWYPVYCMGETLDSDFFQAYYSPWQQDKLTAEIRLSSQGETLDWIVGVYRDESNDSWQAPFAGGTTGGRYNGRDGNTYQDSISLQYMEFYHACYTLDGDFGQEICDGTVIKTWPEATDWWYAESDTDWEQTAIFGEVKWHITDAVDLTLGGRYFDRTNNNLYRVDHPGDLGLNGEPDPADAESRTFRLDNNNRAPDRKATETEFIPKVSLSYAIDDDRMVYGLYTQGTRPGGVNRSRGEPFFSTTYQSDTMDNYELGYRSTFGNGRGRFNATAYHMVWTDYQLELTDPSNVPCANPGEVIPNLCGQPWQAIVTNAGEAHITGVNFELDYAISDSWVFGANATSREAETDTTADLTGDGENDLVGGLRLPITPEVKGSAWLDFTKPSTLFGAEEAFARLQASYTGDSVNTLNPASKLESPMPQLMNEAYVLTDIRAGVRGTDWELAFFVNNITDERAAFNIGSARMNWAFANAAEGRDHFQRRFVARPREFGMRYMKRWGD